jgi:hypothetical protein
MIEWYKILGIVIALIVIYFIGYFLVKDSAKKDFKKAKGYHKEAERYYEDGDYDLADEYYAKADEHRKKGWEKS